MSGRSLDLHRLVSRVPRSAGTRLAGVVGALVMAATLGLSALTPASAASTASTASTIAARMWSSRA